MNQKPKGVRFIVVCDFGSVVLSRLNHLLLTSAILIRCSGFNMTHRNTAVRNAEPVALFE